MTLPAPSSDATCLVTGASSGIGTAFAAALARRGHNVTIAARRLERLETLAERLTAAHGVRVDPHRCDLSDQADRDTLLDALRDRPVDLLINNAGYGMAGRWLEQDRRREREMVRLIVDAPLQLCRELIPGMVERGRGGVMNVGSIVSFSPTPNMATYAAAKAFSLSLTEALHAELRGTGVTVTAFCPGPVRSEFTAITGAHDVADGLPGFLWKEPDEVAEEALAGLAAGRRLVVPGLPTRSFAFAGRHAPHGLMLRVSNNLMSAD